MLSNALWFLFSFFLFHFFFSHEENIAIFQPCPNVTAHKWPTIFVYTVSANQVFRTRIRIQCQQSHYIILSQQRRYQLLTIILVFHISNHVWAYPTLETRYLITSTDLGGKTGRCTKYYGITPHQSDCAQLWWKDPPRLLALTQAVSTHSPLGIATPFTLHGPIVSDFGGRILSPAGCYIWKFSRA